MGKLLSRCFMTIQGTIHIFNCVKSINSARFFLSRVLYFSIHGYQNGAFWPHLRESDYHNIGSGRNGLGYNINVPMNEIKMGNSDYMAIFHQLLLPIAYEVLNCLLWLIKD